jgi:hypothetical protein
MGSGTLFLTGSAMDSVTTLEVKAFAAADVAQFMWGWRMPFGGTHEAMWSMKAYLTGLH